MVAPSPHNWQHQFIETNRIRLHCITQGEGELVILLHGFLEFWYSWRYQIPSLANQFKVVVPDLRGYNDSDKPQEGYDLDTLSQDIYGIIQGLGYQQANIVGHDWGGTIAWHLAHKLPHSINRLALLNAPHPQRFRRELFSNLDQLRRSWYLLALQIPDLPEWLLEQALTPFVTNLFRQQAVRKGAFSVENTALYQAALQKPGAIAAAIRHYRQFLAPSAWLSHIGKMAYPVSVPTLVLWGEGDTLLNRALLDGMERFIYAPFRVKCVPNCGHWIQQEVPQVVNRELLQFLCEV